MADTVPDKTPDIDARTWRQVLTPWAIRLGVSLLAMLVGAVLTRYGVEPKTVEKVTEIIVTVPAAVPLDEFTPQYAPTQGWVRDDAQIEANKDEEKTLRFHNTPAGKAVMGDEDVFLYRHVRKAGKFEGNAYPNINQGSVGCCVGAGFKHGCDVVQATAIAGGARFEWKPVSAEAIYAYSRVEIGGGRISGDGSLGAWAKDAVAKGGILAMQQYDGHDLSKFDPARARAWGRTGVPDALEPIAKNHPVKGTALVTTVADCKRAIQQGYPVPICSDQGFTMERDRDGFARPQGQWMHCMCVIGWRGGARPGFLILNSWGDQAHTGPVWPPDMPVAAFWCDEATMGRIVKQGDSFALSDVQGFPARRVPLNWDVRATPRPRPFDVFASEFALAP